MYNQRIVKHVCWQKEKPKSKRRRFIGSVVIRAYRKAKPFRNKTEKSKPADVLLESMCYCLKSVVTKH
jgi:hypothetical protein